jgi:hypothetical protein
MYHTRSFFIRQFLVLICTLPYCSEFIETNINFVNNLANLELILPFPDLFRSLPGKCTTTTQMHNYTNAQQLHKCTTTQMHNYTNVQQLHKCTTTQMNNNYTNAQQLHKCTTTQITITTQMHNYTNAQLHKCTTTTQMHNYTNAQLHKCTATQMHNNYTKQLPNERCKNCSVQIKCCKNCGEQM